MSIQELGQQLDAEFITNKALRREKELEWIAALRQFKGEYDPSIKFAENASKVYPKYTRAKVMGVVSRLNSMLLPDNDRNWEIGPTPSPSIRQDQADAVISELEKRLERDAGTDEAIAAIKEFVNLVAERMRTTMDDQLEELDYRRMVRQVIFSGTLYGDGIIKGPLSTKVTTFKSSYEGNQFKQNEEELYRPYLCNRPIWSIYPDMSGSSFNADCDFIYDRHIMTKHEIRTLAKRGDFKEDVITKYLKEHPAGDYTPETWEQDIYKLANKDVDYSSYRRYQVLERWGYIDADILRASGVEVDDDLMELSVVVWLLGGNVIKIEENPSPRGVKPFYSFQFEEDEASVFGRGLASVISGAQDIICAASRMLIDNAAHVAGPQIEVIEDYLLPGQNLMEFYPLKPWIRSDTGATTAYSALRPVEIESHIPDFISIIELFRGFGDEESTFSSSMPLTTPQSDNETARAASIRAATDNLTVRDVVKRFDEMNEALIKSLYEWNMEFNPDETIKGDMNVKARGASSLVAKEVRMQAMDMFASTLSDEERMYLKSYNFLKARLKLHDLDPDEMLHTEDEVQKIKKANAARAQKAAEAQDAETMYTKSKGLHMLAKAEDTKIDAARKAMGGE